MKMLYCTDENIYGFMMFMIFTLCLFLHRISPIDFKQFTNIEKINKQNHIKY